MSLPRSESPLVLPAILPPFATVWLLMAAGIATRNDFGSRSSWGATSGLFWQEGNKIERANPAIRPNEMFFEFFMFLLFSFCVSILRCEGSPELAFYIKTQESALTLMSCLTFFPADLPPAP